MIYTRQFCNQLTNSTPPQVSRRNHSDYYNTPGCPVFCLTHLVQNTRLRSTSLKHVKFNMVLVWRSRGSKPGRPRPEGTLVRLAVICWTEWYRVVHVLYIWTHPPLSLVAICWAVFLSRLLRLVASLGVMVSPQSLDIMASTLPCSLFSTDGDVAKKSGLKLKPWSIIAFVTTCWSLDYVGNSILEILAMIWPCWQRMKFLHIYASCKRYYAVSPTISQLHVFSFTCFIFQPSQKKNQASLQIFRSKILQY